MNALTSAALNLALRRGTKKYSPCWSKQAIAVDKRVVFGDATQLDASINGSVERNDPNRHRAAC